MLTVAEARRLLTAARGDRLEALWVLQLTAGLRLGEVLGLQWEDVDLANRRLTIVLSSSRSAASLSLARQRRRAHGAPSTLAHSRSMHSSVVRQWLGRRGTTVAWVPTGGTPQRRSNLRRRHFAPLLERAKLSDVRIHDLRHAMTFVGDRGQSRSQGPGRAARSFDRSDDRGQVRDALPGLQRTAARAIDKVLEGRVSRK